MVALAALQTAVRKDRFTLVDGLRGIAALAVLIFHLYEGHHVDHLAEASPIFAVELVDHANLGVAIFFVLSGFVIAHSLYGKIITIKTGVNFMLRRSLRLDPPYWAAIALTLAFAYLSTFFVDAKVMPAVTRSQILAHVFYLQDILGFAAISVIFWTLCLEVQFYLIYVLLLLSSSRFPRAVMAAAFAISLVWPLGLAVNPWPGVFLSTWHTFLLGVAAYWAWRDARGNAFALGFIILVCAVTIHRFNWFSVVCVGTSITLWLAAMTGKLYTALNWRWLQYLGTISYSLYLTHNPITGATFRLGYRLTGDTLSLEIVWAIVTIAACLSFAYLFWRIFEVPSIQLARLATRP